jgi:hypothetical protein
MQKTGASRSVKIAAFLFSAALFIGAAVALDMMIARLAPTGVNEADPKLGWRMKKNITYTREKATFAGRKYQVTLATDEHGTRTYGANRNAPVKILVFGDSFTGEPYASNDQMWYAALVRQLAVLTGRPSDDFYVVAAGSGGYGTLQNLLLAEEVKTFYQPTILIHQFCDNDFSNNSFEMEQKSVVLNQWMQRPYLARDRETIIWHEGALARLYRAMLFRSALFGVFDRALQVSLSNHYGGYLMISNRDGDAYLKALRAATYDPEAIDLTGFLLGKLRQAFDSVPAVLVDCPIEPTSSNRIWVDIARRAGFTPATTPSDMLLEAKRRGELDLFATDGAHLSETGNELMGALLAKEILSLGIISNGAIR